MRLIDADKLKLEFDVDPNSIIEMKAERLYKVLLEWVNDTPTENAIPISWLQEQAEFYKRSYEAEVDKNGFDAGRYYLNMYHAVNTLLDNWESENG